MFPIGDDDSQERTVPVVTYALIALNVLFFLVELSGGDQFIDDWAFVPARFSAHPEANAVTIFSSMFMHGSWLHLGGNMLFLWIFGDNVEDQFGHAKFVIFYLLAGIAATFAQYFVSPESTIPNVGASGAIAGVLGAYIFMFPKSRVNVLVGRQIVALPAFIVLGLWIALQFVPAVGSIAATDQSAGGVAYMAHVGGFVSGIAMTFLFRPTRDTGTAV